MADPKTLIAVPAGLVENHVAEYCWLYLSTCLPIARECYLGCSRGKAFSQPLLLLCPIVMSNPVPLRALVGGVGIALASHNLLLLNGSVFGISGFIHRCCHGALEPIFSVGGLVFGGVAIGALRSTVPPSILPNVISLPVIATSGFLVGVGTKVRLASRKMSPA